MTALAAAREQALATLSLEVTVEPGVRLLDGLDRLTDTVARLGPRLLILGPLIRLHRADDMLKVGGIWVSPVEVENTLVGHGAVLEAAVVGHEDTDGLAKPKAFVVLKDGHTAPPGL